MLHYLCGTRLNSDRATAPIGSAIARFYWYLALSRTHAQVGPLDRSQTTLEAQPRDHTAISPETLRKQARSKNAIEVVIVDRLLDRDWTINPGATKWKTNM